MIVGSVGGGCDGTKGVFQYHNNSVATATKFVSFSHVSHETLDVERFVFVRFTVSPWFPRNRLIYVGTAVLCTKRLVFVRRAFSNIFYVD